MNNDIVNLINITINSEGYNYYKNLLMLSEIKETRKKIEESETHFSYTEEVKGSSFKYSAYINFKDNNLIGMVNFLTTDKKYYNTRKFSENINDIERRINNETGKKL